MSSTDISMQDRYRGTLVGLGCGDALGGPVEFMTPEKIAQAHPDGVRTFLGGGWLHLAPGEITDDTQMTLAMCDALDASGVNMDRLVEQFVAWYASQPKDIGNTTRAALKYLAEGGSWEKSGPHAVCYGSKSGGAANGGVMRCAPVALRFRTDPVRLVTASLDTARVTHDEERAKWATVAINQAIVHLLEGGARESVLDAAVVGVPNAQLREAVLAAPSKDASELRAGGFVIETVQAALWSLLTASTAEEAIILSVNLGNDADTTGAVAGALAGAHWGMAALPDAWTAILEPRDLLIAHADRLLALAG